MLNPNEPIDLNHNNPKSVFYKRKLTFEKFEVYRLSLMEHEFIVKFGVFKGNKGLSLYCITG